MYTIRLGVFCRVAYYGHCFLYAFFAGYVGYCQLLAAGVFRKNRCAFGFFLFADLLVGLCCFHGYFSGLYSRFLFIKHRPRIGHVVSLIWVGSELVWPFGFICFSFDGRGQLFVFFLFLLIVLLACSSPVFFRFLSRGTLFFGGPDDLAFSRRPLQSFHAEACSL